MRAAVAGLAFTIALSACERFQANEPPPTYVDTKLDAVRADVEPAPAAPASAPASASKPGP